MRRWHLARSAVARGCRRAGGEDDVHRMLRALARFVIVLDMLVGGCVCARAVVSGSLCGESALAPCCPRACVPEGSVWSRHKSVGIGMVGVSSPGFWMRLMIDLLSAVFQKRLEMWCKMWPHITFLTPVKLFQDLSHPETSPNTSDPTHQYRSRPSGGRLTSLS